MIIANCVALLATELLPMGDDIVERFALFNVAGPLFKSYQVFTYMFLHGGVSHLFFNMFALWMFGRQLEYELGSQRFFTYYIPFDKAKYRCYNEISRINGRFWNDQHLHHDPRTDRIRP